MLGPSALPSEVLRTILLDVKPNDIIAIASANWHLRRAVPACIDHALAKRHMAAAGCEPSGPVPKELRLIHFDHRLLFEHAVVVVSLYGISNKAAGWIWGNKWKPHLRDEKAEEIRRKRLHVVRTALKKRISLLIDSATDPFILTLDENNAQYAFEMAGLLRSIELFDQLRGVFPAAINDQSRCRAFRRFIFGCAASGFCDGLILIPREHPILHSDMDCGIMIQTAVESRHLPAVKFLLDIGVPVNYDVDDSDIEIKPPLLFALEDDAASLEILRLLLQHGADPNSIYGPHEIALHRAAQLGQPQALKMLLEYGADIDIRGDDEIHTLHLAAGSNRGQGSDCLVALLDAGADVNVANKNGRTPLFTACSYLCKDKVRILLDHGATVNPSGVDDSPLHAVLQSDYDTGVLEIVKVLVEAGAELDFLDKQKETPLHLAVRECHPTSALFLLNSGANPSSKCRSERTPLQLLLEQLRDDACREWDSDWEELVEGFIQKGVDLKESCTSGKTVWQELCLVALQDRGLLEWLMTREEVDDDTRKTFVAVWDRLFLKFDA
ncbi:hypothetical protein HDU96_001696 [Phlyctochytrium bullatum]|nr:hypothetical protein HDU96_001696 [Phlyctochytrium bullatum]